MLIPAKHPLATYLREPALQAGKKPVGHVVFDQSNWHAHGLCYAFCGLPSMQDATADDITRKNTVLSVSGAVRQREFIEFNTYTDEVQIARSAAIEPDYVTIITKCNIIKGGTGNYSVILSKDHTSYTAPYYSYHLHVRTQYDRLEFSLGNGSTNFGASQGNYTFAPYYGVDCWIVSTYDGTNASCDLLIDDAGNTLVVEASSAASFGPIGYSATDLHLGDTHSNVLRGMGGGSRLYEAYIFDHAKTLDDAREFIADRFSILQPANQSPYLVPVAATGGTTVSLVPDTLTITDGTLAVQADVDTNITLSEDALAITDGTLIVSRSAATYVTLVPDSLAITDGSLGVQADVDTNATLVPDTLAITDGSFAVTSATSTSIALVPDALTITDGSLGVQANVNLNVDMLADSIIITDGLLTVSTISPLATLAANESATFYMREGTAYRIFN